MSDLNREALIEDLKRLDLKRAELSELVNDGKAGPETSREIRRVRTQMRAINHDLNKLKTEDWRKEPEQFCRVFKAQAKRILDAKTYEAIVHETAEWLKRHHRRMKSYNPKNYEIENAGPEVPR